MIKPNTDEAQPSRDPETYAIIGAAMEVHRELGAGFLEPVYQEAGALELSNRDIPFQREVELAVAYKTLSSIEESQLLNYLKATGLQRGLLLNFGAARLDYRRMVREWRASDATSRDYLRPSASSADRRGES